MLSLLPLTPAECESWLGAHYPKEDPMRLHQAALNCQGVLGSAVEEVEGTGAASAAVREMAQTLARAMEQGDELELFRTAMSLEKMGKEELGGVLDHTVVEIAAILPVSREKRRLLRAVELLRKLRGAVELNANAGQLSGWLCAGLFVED
jgi:DNA polymerase-3 subunit delta'